ncbi:MAG: hypothetical protein IPL60_10530 [Ardenticatenia bacterium]|nr:hypothetical protein [Ardenticatenia bacterium]
MNLFWETRHLTQAREDHLTCFVAAALESDSLFRAAYERSVLEPLTVSGRAPSIASVSIQVAFADHRSQPDMELNLSDGRRVICEHKIDATETMQLTEDGVTSLQLERYLALPGVDAVAYFRSSLKPPADAVLDHPKYLRPTAAPHFLWRDLYRPLVAGDQPISAWLRDGFERLGFTPPLPHIGELWPVTDEVIKDNQRNFGKLWHRTRSHLSSRWKTETGSRCELYLTPKVPGLVRLAFVSPLMQGGSLLRFRVHTDRASIGEVQRRLAAVIPDLPTQPEMAIGKRPDGTPSVDIVASLRLVLGDEADAARQEARLYAQVVPLVDALLPDSAQTQMPQV